MSDRTLRSNLIRVAASLPKGSSGRRAVLGLLKTGGMTKLIGKYRGLDIILEIEPGNVVDQITEIFPSTGDLVITLEKDSVYARVNTMWADPSTRDVTREEGSDTWKAQAAQAVKKIRSIGQSPDVMLDGVAVIHLKGA